METPETPGLPRSLTQAAGLLGLLVSAARVVAELDDDLQHPQEEALRRRLGGEHRHGGQLQLAAAQSALLRRHDHDALGRVEAGGGEAEGGGSALGRGVGRGDGGRWGGEECGVRVERGGVSRDQN